MSLSYLRAWLGLALMWVFTLAAADVPSATAEALMHKSGVTAQLGDVAPQVLAGIHQSAAADGGHSDRRALARLEELAQDSFAQSRLQRQFAQVLAQHISPAHAAAALKWYDSPTGARITALEVASSAQDDDPAQAVAQGNAVLERATARRQALLTQLVQATLAAEAMVTLQINTTVGVLQGVASVAGDSAAPLDALRSRLASQRPQMLAASRGMALTLFARTYQDASDKALEQYLRFLGSPAGAAVSQAMVEALDQTLSSAAQRLGRGLNSGNGTSL
jgi:uncharacterized protein YukE